MYSFNMSAWTVPLSFVIGTPFFFPTAAYMQVKTAAGAFIVIDVLTRSRGMPSKIASMSFREETFTPHRPTSPWDFGWSQSYPYRVGISNAMLRPVSPCWRRSVSLRFVSSGVPYPENILIVHSLPRYMFG